jgi:hypothetical protein
MHRAPSILPNKWPENPMPNHTIVLALRGLVLDFSTNEMDRRSKCAARVRGTRVAAPHLADEIGGTGTFADSVLAKVGGKLGVAGAIFISAVYKYRYDDSDGGSARVTAVRWDGPLLLRTGWRTSVHESATWSWIGHLGFTYQASPIKRRSMLTPSCATASFGRKRGDRA